VCGSRLTMNFFRPGGSVRDVPEDFTDRVRAVCGKVDAMLAEFDRLLTGNLITKERARGIGVLPRAEAIALGCTGPVLRGSGVDFDLRKKAPYGYYDRFEFSVPLGEAGDSWDRYLIRMEEMRQSLRILEQACRSFPGGPYRSKEKPAYRLPTGTWFGAVETPRGVFSTWIVAEKGEKPWRIHSRSPSLANLAALNPMCVGHKIADLITILATIDPVIPDMDR